MSKKQIHSKSLEVIEAYSEYSHCAFFFRENNFQNNVIQCHFENCSFRTDVMFGRLENCKFTNCSFWGKSQFLDIEDCFFRNVNIPYGIFLVSLRNTTFEDCDLHDTCLESVQVESTNFIKVCLQKAKIDVLFSGNSTFQFCDLSSANLESSSGNFSIENSNCSHANLKLISCFAGSLHNTNFSFAHLQQIYCRDIDFSGANLQDAIVLDADLEDANFTNANLQNCNLKFSNLAGASFVNANLQHTNMNCCSLMGAKFSDSQLEHTDLGFTYLHCAEITIEQLAKCKIRGKMLVGSCQLLQQIKKLSLYLVWHARFDEWEAEVKILKKEEKNLNGVVRPLPRSG
ncbi:pentapeptide repeat-containing protein [Candidatus Uabimicrobium sp. HlEnr_7]|uniref:pentapeptide repeat-containing protein n=1 Tax=Candidatus Uabimicrobium helgolandensis TaxID=3095367 RepID=UPI0035568D55